MTPTPLASRATFAATAAVLAIASALSTGCEGKHEAPAAANAAVRTESYPARNVFASTRADSKDPRKPPRTLAEAKTEAERIVARLRAPGADFAAVARAESDDPISAVDGGFGGFLATWALSGDDARRDRDRAFVNAVARLRVGEVSDPVPSGNEGWQVFQRLSREEGKAAEAQAVAGLDGFFLPIPRAGASDPAVKAHIYETASAAANDLRQGRTTFPENVGSVPGAGARFFVLRRATVPGWAPVVAATFAAEPDVWLGPLESPEGWAVVRRRPYARCVVRHLLVTHVESLPPYPRANRPPEAAAEIANAALERLRKDPGSWDREVAATSDDPQSKDVGGYTAEVCTVAPIEFHMPPEIEKVVLALKPGERSGVVESRFGFHIFWRVD